jgi:asparagine synthase (glutamine-hydrolysing)
LLWGRPYFACRLRQRLLNPALLRELGADLEAPERFLLARFAAGSGPLDSMTRTHFGSILPDDFLVKVDRASMAHSLEVRAPFLDHRLIEFAFGQLPADWKVKGGESRRLQRRLGQQWLPADLDTQRKQGFSIPLNEWLRQEGESGLFAKMEGLPDIIDLDAVKGLIRGQMAGRANGGRLFALMMLALAMRNAAS